jgi:DNA-binding transcriptional LysR family regulator
MQRPNLSHLDVFAAIARHGSFRRAAAEAGMSTSAVSHAIRGLEERLGVSLFNRTTRSVALTEAGQRLLERLQPAHQHLACRGPAAACPADAAFSGGLSGDPSGGGRG